MKLIKTLSFIASSFAVLAVALAPLQASALSTASMTLAGASQTNGSFSVVVYEDTGSDTVTGANVDLSFSSAVSGVSYDYGVGPFTAVTPSGAHNAYGTVTGSNPVARVSFTLANPGSVTASVSGSSYLKHAGDTSVESFAINRGGASFTYTAPVTGGQGGGSDSGSSSSASSSSNSAASSNSTKAATSSTTSNNTSAATGETKDASTTAASDDSKKAASTKKTDATNTANKKSGSKAWLWAILVIVLAAAAALAVRKKQAIRAKNAQATKDSKASKSGKSSK